MSEGLAKCHRIKQRKKGKYTTLVLVQLQRRKGRYLTREFGAILSMRMSRIALIRSCLVRYRETSELQPRRRTPSFFLPFSRLLQKDRLSSLPTFYRIGFLLRRNSLYHYFSNEIKDRRYSQSKQRLIKGERPDINSLIIKIKAQNKRKVRLRVTISPSLKNKILKLLKKMSKMSHKVWRMLASLQQMSLKSESLYNRRTILNFHQCISFQYLIQKQKSIILQSIQSIIQKTT